MDNQSQNGYAMDIKDPEADQELDGVMTLIQYVFTYLKSHCERRGCGKHVERGSSLGTEKHPD